MALGGQSLCEIHDSNTGEAIYRCWTLWKPGSKGTGTKMTIAFLPWPTSIYDLQTFVSFDVQIRNGLDWIDRNFEDVVRARKTQCICIGSQDM